MTKPFDPSESNVLRMVPAGKGLSVAFLGTYPPRRCGIATFTQDLSTAMRSAGPLFFPMTVAVTDPAGQYEYGGDVRYEIRQAEKGDYARAAEFINFSDVRLVYLQHEYGIFGGDDGVYVLDFLAALRVPTIVTLHTVLRKPSDSQRMIVREMARQGCTLVVMSQIAAELLDTSYGVSGETVRVIPHGIPEMAERDQGQLKEGFGIPGQRMLLTFGLLSPNKGIETVIRALPPLVAQFPDLVYFVVGATHPVIARRQGEAYRTTLEREAERLGVREHVVFRDQFVSSVELCAYLQAADIFVSPYLNEAQVTSGALSYAMGAGAAVVSTPYWHAREILGEGRGRLFPFSDSGALCKAIAELFLDETELRRVRANALAFTRTMTWPNIGKAYLELGKAALASTPDRKPVKGRRDSIQSVPELRLDHLVRLTDDTGIIQHATFTVPARRTGYCVDDNARALIVALEADRLTSSLETTRLVATYLAYLHHSQADDGGFRNLMRYDRVFESDIGSDDCLGRAIWALGVVIAKTTDDGQRMLAKGMFPRALDQSKNLGPRGAALCILGLVNVLSVEPGSGIMRAALDRLTNQLLDRYQGEASPEWRWFEPNLTYDNAMIPLALFKAYAITGERTILRVARESLEFLETICFHEKQLVLVGNAGWCGRGKDKASADEQAIDAAAFVMAFHGAFLATADHHYLRRMHESFAWFLGTNRLGLPLYDFVTAGCRDGLGATEVNQNEGAESTLSFLMALLEMLEVAGVGLEYLNAPPAMVR